MHILQTEQKHWYSVIERILHVVKFLAKQNLVFRESSNKLFESEWQFLESYRNDISVWFHNVRTYSQDTAEKKNDESVPTYLGNIIQNEIISLIADNIR